MDNASALVVTGSVIVTGPVLTLTKQDFTAFFGIPFSGPVATFSDNNPGAVPTDYSASIDWGDGQTSAGRIEPRAEGGFNVIGSHTYLSPPQPPTSSTFGFTVFKARPNGTNI